MKKNKHLTCDQDIDRIIERNRELIEALKNLNEKLCCGKSDLQRSVTGFPENDIRTGAIPAE